MKKRSSLKGQIIIFISHHRWLYQLLHSVVMIIRRATYLMICVRERKINQHLILFESFGGRSYSGNPKALFLALKNELGSEAYQCVWCYRNPEEFLLLEDMKDVKIVLYRSKEYYRFYARAKYWITNYRLPPELIKKKQQICLQCWHGVPFKRLGYDIQSYKDRFVSTKELRRQYTKAVRQYTFFLSPSDYYTEHMATAFALKEKKKNRMFLQLGYPRNDWLYQAGEKEREEIRRKLNIKKEQICLLYCPTYRDDQYKDGTGNTLDIGLDFCKLRKLLGENYVILFRAHYLIKSKFDFESQKGFVVDVSKYPEINELYVASDALITDYSSVMFDYAILNRPILLYMYDYMEYKNRLRDFYLTEQELPTKPVLTVEELALQIQSMEQILKSNQYQLFNHRHNSLNGPYTSKKVLNTLFHTD